MRITFEQLKVVPDMVSVSINFDNQYFSTIIYLQLPQLTNIQQYRSPSRSGVKAVSHSLLISSSGTMDRGRDRR